MVQNVYTDCFIPEIGCRLYLDASGEVAAPAGKYSDGTYCYSVDSGGFVTAVNICGETTTTTSTTSTTSTSTTSTSTTSTSTSTSTSTTTTTAAPVFGAPINYRIAIPETGTYNYSFTPFSASIFPASFFTPTSSGVLSVINNSTRYAFSSSQTLYNSDGTVATIPPGGTASIPPILFNAISGSFVCDVALLPYVTQSTLPAEYTLCSGFQNFGTGSMTYVGCSGAGLGPITANSVYASMVGTFPTPVFGGASNPTASFFGDGTFKPNPIPTKAGTLYNEAPAGSGVGNLYKYLNVVIYSPGYATQSAWIPNGTYTEINGVPIVAGTKVEYFQNSNFDYNEGFGGTQTQVSMGANVFLNVHTYTASGDLTYRYQNQF